MSQQSMPHAGKAPHVVFRYRAPQDLVGCGHASDGVDSALRAGMQVTAPHGVIRDWTYRAARNRMVRAGRARLPGHVAVASIDNRGNRLVDCGCGWRGNGIGWAAHLDSVVRVAVDEDRLP